MVDVGVLSVRAGECTCQVRVQMRGRVVARMAVTVNLTGKPVQLRVTNGPNVLNPSSVTFRPPAGSGVESFSASFAGGQETGNTPLTTQVQWRLVTAGGSAKLHAGSVVVLPGDSHCG